MPGSPTAPGLKRARQKLRPDGPPEPARPGQRAPRRSAITGSSYGAVPTSDCRRRKPVARRVGRGKGPVVDQHAAPGHMPPLDIASMKIRSQPRTKGDEDRALHLQAVRRRDVPRDQVVRDHLPDFARGGSISRRSAGASARATAHAAHHVADQPRDPGIVRCRDLRHGGRLGIALLLLRDAIGRALRMATLRPSGSGPSGTGGACRTLRSHCPARRRSPRPPTLSATAQ